MQIVYGKNLKILRISSTIKSRRLCLFWIFIPTIDPNVYVCVCVLVSALLFAKVVWGLANHRRMLA